MTNITFFPLCFTSSFAVGFAGLLLGRKKSRSSFWAGQISFKIKYLYMTLLGVHRLPMNLHCSEQIPLAVQSDLFIHTAQLGEKPQNTKNKTSFLSPPFCFLPYKNGRIELLTLKGF